MMVDVVEVVHAALVEAGVEFESPNVGHFVVTLPGEHKLKTTCSMVLGDKALTVNAFVARRPDEHMDVVHTWLLERNRRMYLVAFSLDHLGDIYLTGKIPLAAINPDLIDQLLGAVLAYADDSFNTILEIGFATAIRREWQWRTERGESTANLAAFRHLAADPSTDG